MTVLENVLVGMHCRTRAGSPASSSARPARAEQRRVRAEALELLGFFRDRLAPRAAQPAVALYANRRRLEIARASPRARACCSSTSRPPA